jgi:hypothetical protein
MEQTRQNAIIGTGTWDAYRLLRLAILLVGPFATLAFAGRIGANVEAASLEAVAVLLWSPLFFSVPALMLQNERDRALENERNFLVRGIKLLPHLLAKGSPVRAETLVSTVTWLCLLAMTGDSLATVVVRTVTNIAS